MTDLQIGLIGLGYWGGNLMRTFGGTAGARIVAVCDGIAAQREVAAKSLGDAVHVYDRAEALCADPAINTVAVATPPSTHFEVARQALRAGKHCWVEKPLALRASEGRELVDLARANHVTLFVDETFLYDPLIQRAKEWITAGRLGRLYHLSFERLGMGRVRRDSNVWWNSAPHDLSILRYLAPAEVAAIRVEQFIYLQPGLADMCVATIRLSDGVSAHVYLSWLSPVKAASVVAVGSGGMLQFEGRFGQRKLTFFDYTIADPAAVKDNVVPISNFKPSEEIKGGDEEPLALAAEAFVRSVQTGVPAPSAGEYSARVVELLEAAEDGES
ncbi:MAG TPA: Gfo/Idh/MocA family oxidoreductase [Candidatus Binatia bacterium]|nr:Gfo/Idh/MocA family oxidoreductase [Candidatus Binatia bacterium]